MRVKRRKTTRRALRMFKIQYGITPPFKVLVDGNFFFAAARKKLLPLEEHISNALDNQPVVIMSCSAVLDELRKLQASQHSSAPEEVQDAFRIALDAVGASKKLKPWVKPSKLKQQQQQIGQEDKNTHKGEGEGAVATSSSTSGSSTSSSNDYESISAADALFSLVGSSNRHRYVVATQDEQLKERLRAVPGIPILTVSRTMVAMEPPSNTTTSHTQRSNERKLAPSKSDRRFLHDQFVERRQAGEAPQQLAGGGAGGADKPITKKRLRQLKRAAAAATQSSVDNAGTDEPSAKKTRSRSRTKRKHTTVDE